MKMLVIAAVLTVLGFVILGLVLFARRRTPEGVLSEVAEKAIRFTSGSLAGQSFPIVDSSTEVNANSVLPTPPAPPPSRAARRAGKRPANKLRNVGQGQLKMLEIASRKLVQRAMKDVHQAGPGGTAVTTNGYVMTVFTGDSPLNRALPPGERVNGSSASLRFVDRASLAKFVRANAGEQMGRQIEVPHPCGHWWVLFSTKNGGRFCCTRCDLKIEGAA